MPGCWHDRVVLLLTFALTVMFDLAIAIEVGLVLAAFLFMHRMAEVASLLSDHHSAADAPPLRVKDLQGIQPSRR